MRRFLFVVLTVVMCLLLFTGCDQTQKEPVCEHHWERAKNFNEYTAVDQCAVCGVTRMYTDPDKISHSGTETGFRMLRYNWDGYGIGQKEIRNCDLGYAIIDCLSDLKETGELLPKISDDAVNEFAGILPITSGTVWIECGDVGLFRLDPEMREICKVQTHLGEGRRLQMTETLQELLWQAWYYHPYDYWSGVYENGEGTVQPIYKAASAVEWVTLESISVENEIGSENNTLTLRIRANESKRVEACLESYQSDDNRGSYELKEIELVNGGDTVVTFTFTGFYPHSYRVSVVIDNTKIVLTINP